MDKQEIYTLAKRLKEYSDPYENDNFDTRRKYAKLRRRKI